MELLDVNGVDAEGSQEAEKSFHEMGLSNLLIAFRFLLLFAEE